MVRRIREQEGASELIEAQEILDNQLKAEYDDIALKAVFGAYEAAVVAATTKEPTTLVEGFTSLANYSEKAQLAADKAGAMATAEVFGGKRQTLIGFLEPVTKLPKIKPKKTDTNKRKMDQKKG